MADEHKTDWQKELDEQEAKRKEMDAEYERKMKSLHRWEAVAYCLQLLAITFLTAVVCFGAFELGRRLELRAEKQHQEACVVESAKVQAGGLPTIVHDDLFNGYVMVSGAEVHEFTRDGGLTPSPR